MRTYLIGRGEANDIVLDDLTVSRQHAELEDRGDGQFVLRDLDSTYGTRAHLGIGWRNEASLDVQADTRVRFGDYETTVADLLTLADERPPLDPSDPLPTPPRTPTDASGKSQGAEPAAKASSGAPRETARSQRRPSGALAPQPMRPPIAARVSTPRSVPWRPIVIIILVLGLGGAAAYWFGLRDTPSARLASACREGKPVPPANCRCYATNLTGKLQDNDLETVTAITRRPQDERQWGAAYLGMSSEARRRWTERVAPLMAAAVAACRTA